MATETITIAVRVDDEATAGLRKATGEVGDLDQRANRASGSVGGMGSKLGKLGAVAGVAGAAIVGVGAAIAGAAAAGKALIEVTGALLEDWQEQTTAVNALSDSLGRTGLAGTELAGALEEANSVAGDFAARTMFGDEEILEAMAQYTSLTGDATMETEQLDTVLGLAARTGKDATEASEIYAKALKGEIGPLKDITTLTNTQEKELAALEGTSEQAARVTELLSNQFGGFAEKVEPSALATKNLNDAFGDLKQALGGVISQSGAIPAVLGPITDIMREIEAAVFNNSEEWQVWLLDGVVGVAKGLNTFLSGVRTALPVMDAMYTTVKVMANVWTIWQRSVIIVYKSLASFLSDVLGKAVGKLSEFVGFIGEVATAVGMEGMGGAFTRVSKIQKDFGDGLEGLSDKLDDSLREDAEGIKTDINDISDAYEGAGKITETIGPAIDRVNGGLVAIIENAGKARERVKKVSATSGASGGGGGGGTTDQDETTEKTKEETKAVEDNTEAYEKFVEQSRRAAAAYRAADDARRERIRDMAEENQQAKEQVDILGQLSDALRGIDTLGLEGFDRITEGVANLAVAFRDLDGSAEETGRAVGAALGGVAQLTSGVAEAAGASAREQAAILAVFEAAQAAAAFATFATTGVPSFAVAGAQHTVAAGLYTAVAAGAGSGGSAPSGGAGAAAPSGGGSASGGGPGGGGRASLEDVAQIQAEALADVLNERGRGDTVINLDVRAPSSREAADEFVRTVRGDAQLSRLLINGAR